MRLFAGLGLGCECDPNRSFAFEFETTQLTSHLALNWTFGYVLPRQWSWLPCSKQPGSVCPLAAASAAMMHIVLLSGDDTQTQISKDKVKK